MTQDRTDMRVLRGAPDAQDVTPAQRACEHSEVARTWTGGPVMCVDCGRTPDSDGWEAQIEAALAHAEELGPPQEIPAYLREWDR